MRCTAARQIDSRSRPSMGKRLSWDGPAHRGGYKLADCKTIFGGDAPVVGSVVLGFGVGLITIGCKFEE